MFLFCLAYQTASNIELYNNPDKQERKQNETIITASVYGIQYHARLDTVHDYNDHIISILRTTISQLDKN